MSSVSPRYLSLWLRRLATDRLIRRAPAPDAPFVTVGAAKNTRVLRAVNDAAMRAGLKPGMAFADAMALSPKLVFAEAAPEEDAKLLVFLCDACERYTPFAALDAPDGILLDITGAAHLFGGEAALAEDLLLRLAKQGFRARFGIADSVGAAWAVARFGKMRIVPRGESHAALADLPLAALRLSSETLSALREMGFATIGDIAARPRAPLAARFGASLLRRLDQAFGVEEEPITPRFAVPPFSVERGFPEPLSRDEDLLAVLEQLTDLLCQALERRDCGARRIWADFFAVDGAVRRLTLGTYRPLREAKRLHHLLAGKFAQAVWDDSFGYDRIRLSAPVAENFKDAPRDLLGAEEGTELAPLIDRFSARLGEQRVQRLVAQDSHVPEQAWVAMPASAVVEFAHLTARTERTDSLAPARPLRLFEKPEPIEAVADVPDGPPVKFRWRRVLHEIVRSEGPERIALPWWRDGPRMLTRDYFRVETREGARFWLYRDGLYARETAAPHWYLHGLLA